MTAALAVTSATISWSHRNDDSISRLKRRYITLHTVAPGDDDDDDPPPSEPPRPSTPGKAPPLPLTQPLPPPVIDPPSEPDPKGPYTV